MSLATLGAEPQPSLAWTFESSNVDYVTGLTPSSQVSPGPGQLVGSAALVTNAPTSNTAVYFPGTTSTWMNLGTSTPVNFDTSLSNIFVECWVYSSLAYNPNFIVWHQGALGGQENWSMYFGTSGNLITSIWGDVAGTATQGGTGVGSAIPLNTWTHVGFAIANTASVYKTYIYVNGTPTAYTPPAGWVPKFYAAGTTQIGGRNSVSDLTNMYIRDLRVVQGGVVPTTSFTPSAAPFTYSLPSYVTGSGSTVFTLLGQFVTYVPGKYGQSIKFVNPNGTTVNYITYPISYSPTSFTWAYWVNCAQIPASNIQFPVYFIDSLASSSQMRVGLNPSVTAGSGSKFYMFNGTYLTSPTITQDTWNHVCVVLTPGSGGSTATFYMNGSLVGSFVLNNNQAATITSMTVGSADTQYGALCSIDDLRVYSSALNATQVQSVYTQGGAPASQFRSTPQPNLAWSFDGTTTDYMTGLTPANYIGASANAITYVNAAIYAPGIYGQSINVYNTSNTFYLNTLQYRLPSTIGPPYSVSFWAKQNTIWVPGNGTFSSLLLRTVTASVNSFVIKLASFSPGNSSTSITIADVNNNNSGFTSFTTGGTGKWFFVCISVLPQTATNYFWSPSYSSIQSSTVTTANTWATCQTDIATAIYGYTPSNITNQPFDGLIDDLRIYNTALSAAQVQSIYQAQGMPSRGVQVKVQAPLASMIGQTFTPPNTSGSSPDTSIPGQITLTVAANNKTDQGQVYLTPSITGVSFSVIYRSNSSGGSPASLLSNEGDCFQVGTAFAIDQLSARTFLATVGYGVASSSITSSGVIYYVTCVLQPNGYVYLYINGSLTGSGTTGTIQLPNKMYSVRLGQSRFGSPCDITIWDFFVVNATLNASQVAQVYQNQLANINYNPGNTFNWTPSIATGTPLFSQLSSAAVSSAVGAFSLRAVNWQSTSGSAKAVQVQAHPVVQWPPTAMTANTSVISGQIYGNGTYIASSSNGCVVNQNQEFRAFDYNTGTYYEENYPTGQSYSNFDGSLINPTLVQTTVSGATVQGEWLQIQFPTTVYLRSYEFVPRSANEKRCPRIFWIAGSNDGTTWSNVHQQSGISGYVYPNAKSFTVPVTSNTFAYSYYRVIVNAIVGYGGGGGSPINIASWNLYGDSPSYAPASAQDFYADRLGNLLTAPVTGTPLANWLGGAKGYVTAWYDQSGRGNHATQATAANQPVIQRATKGPGYMCLYSGAQGLTFGTYNLLNNTNYTTCGVVRRTAIPISNFYLCGNNASATQDRYFHSGYRNSTQLTLAHYLDDTNLTVPSFLTSSTEPTAYNYMMVGTGLSGRLYSYSSGTLYSTTRTYTGYLNQPVGASFSIGGGGNNFTGEMYEVLVFTQSLYDLDTTGGLITQIYNNQLSYTGT